MIKLCDFGSALVAARGAASTTLGRSPHGSSLYSAPEVCALQVLRSTAGKDAHRNPWRNGNEFVESILNFGYNAQKADVWSFGITVYKVVFGDVPFNTAALSSSKFKAFVQATQPEVVHDAMCAPESDVWASESTAPWTWPKRATPALTHLLSNCLRLRAVERFSMQQIKSHNWFAAPRWQVPTDEPYIVNTVKGGAKGAESGPPGHLPSAVSMPEISTAKQSAQHSSYEAVAISSGSHPTTVHKAGAAMGGEGEPQALLEVEPQHKLIAAASNQLPSTKPAGLELGPLQPPAAAHAAPCEPQPAGKHPALPEVQPAGGRNRQEGSLVSNSPSKVPARSSYTPRGPTKAFDLPAAAAGAGSLVASPRHSDSSPSTPSAADSERGNHSPVHGPMQRSNASMSIPHLQAQRSVEWVASPAAWGGSASSSPPSSDSTTWSSSPSRSLAAGVGTSLPHSATDEYSPEGDEDSSTWNSPMASAAASGTPTPSRVAKLTERLLHGSRIGTAGSDVRKAVPSLAPASQQTMQPAATRNRPVRASSGEDYTDSGQFVAAHESALVAVTHVRGRRRAASAGSLGALPSATQAARRKPPTKEALQHAPAAPSGQSRLFVDTSLRKLAPSQAPLIDLPAPHPRPGQAPSAVPGSELLCTVQERVESLEREADRT